jgi:hypothetical protein
VLIGINHSLDSNSVHYKLSENVRHDVAKHSQNVPNVPLLFTLFLNPLELRLELILGNLVQQVLDPERHRVHRSVPKVSVHLVVLNVRDKLVNVGNYDGFWGSSRGDSLPVLPIVHKWPQLF